MSEKTTQVTVNRGTKKKVSMRKLTGTAMLSAIASVYYNNRWRRRAEQFLAGCILCTGCRRCISF